MVGESRAQRADGKVWNVVGLWDETVYGAISSADADAEIVFRASEAFRSEGEESREEVSA